MMTTPGKLVAKAMCETVLALAASGDAWQVLLLLPVLLLMGWVWLEGMKVPSQALWRTGASVSLTWSKLTCLTWPKLGVFDLVKG
jgi:hypothetical protein